MVPEKMAYVLAALIFMAAMVYFVVAWQSIGEMAGAETNETRQ